MTDTGEDSAIEDAAAASSASSTPSSTESASATSAATTPAATESTALNEEGKSLSDGTENDHEEPTEITDQVIVDEFAHQYGIEITDTSDADGDGVTDRDEILMLSTDPITVDTFDTGTTDGLSDFDEDGLNNIEEIQHGSEPFYADTDADGLSDSDEVNTYGTDVKNADTDADGIADGTEIKFGLNPLAVSTDGVTPDADRVFDQTLSDTSIDTALLDEGNSAKPSLQMTGNANAGQAVDVASTADSTLYDQADKNGVVGEAIDVSGISAVSSATLTFTVQDQTAPMSTYEIAFYDAQNTLQTVTTSVSETDHTPSANVEEDGT